MNTEQTTLSLESPQARIEREKAANWELYNSIVEARGNNIGIYRIEIPTPGQFPVVQGFTYSDWIKSLTEENLN